MKETVTRIQTSRLDLVYPPISNQEAVWLEHDPDVREELRASDLYMIAARAEAKFTDIELDRETHTAESPWRRGFCHCDKNPEAVFQLLPQGSHMRTMPCLRR